MAAVWLAFQSKWRVDQGWHFAQTCDGMRRQYNGFVQSVDQPPQYSFWYCLPGDVSLYNIFQRNRFQLGKNVVLVNRAKHNIKWSKKNLFNRSLFLLVALYKTKNERVLVELVAMVWIQTPVLYFVLCIETLSIYFGCGKFGTITIRVGDLTHVTLDYLSAKGSMVPLREKMAQSCLYS